MDEFRYVVTVKAPERGLADQVMDERLQHDEEYDDFEYTVDWAPAGQGFVFVSRHPDNPTDVELQGFDVTPEVIEVDLGSSFDITHGITDEEEIDSAWTIVDRLQVALMALGDGPVRNSVQQTIEMLLERLEHVERKLSIVSAYADDVVTIEQTVAIRPPADFKDYDEGAYAEYLNETLVTYTGTGRSGDAYYEVKSLDNLDPEIDLGWQG